MFATVIGLPLMNPVIVGDGEDEKELPDEFPAELELRVEVEVGFTNCGVDPFHTLVADVDVDADADVDGDVDIKL